MLLLPLGGSTDACSGSAPATLAASIMKKVRSFNVLGIKCPCPGWSARCILLHLGRGNDFDSFSIRSGRSECFIVRSNYEPSSRSTWVPSGVSGQRGNFEADKSVVWDDWCVFSNPPILFSVPGFELWEPLSSNTAP